MIISGMLLLTNPAVNNHILSEISTLFSDFFTLIYRLSESHRSSVRISKESVDNLSLLTIFDNSI